MCIYIYIYIYIYMKDSETYLNVLKLTLMSWTK